MKINPRQPRIRGITLCGCWALLGASWSWGAAPVDPLPPPYYSFAIDSPSVKNGVVPPGAVLEFNLPTPLIGFPASDLGLVHPDDDIDALSGNRAGLAADSEFVLLFSVDTTTAGLAPPDPALLNDGLPYNALDQALRGHQGADQFMSLAVFNLSGDILLPPALTFSNALIRNNYDEGGTDFAAVPRTSAHHVTTDPQDRLDASADLTNGRIYFSTTAVSPSLNGLVRHTQPSGADVFYVCLDCRASLSSGWGTDEDNAPAPFEVVLFASAEDLGLEQEDDVDALVVFDHNADGQFNGNDRVLFSLAPGSPSLGAINKVLSEAAAADVYEVFPGNQPSLFAAADTLGLGQAGDNIDALELLLCDDPEACAQSHAIQGVGCVADLDGNDQVNASDLAILLGNWGRCGDPCPADLNGDGAIEAGDLAKMLGDWGSCP